MTIDGPVVQTPRGTERTDNQRYRLVRFRSSRARSIREAVTRNSRDLAAKIQTDTRLSQEDGCCLGTRVLTLYSLYYNETRTHLGLSKDAPRRRAVQRSGPSLPANILSGCIIATCGYDFRDGQSR